MKTRALIFGLGLLLVLFSGGCIFSPDDDGNPPGDPGPKPPDPTYPFPSTADILMSNFQLTYMRMDDEGYRNVLHTNYLFRFQEFDIDELDLPSDHLNRDEDLEVMTRVFSGDAVVNSQGETIPGISQITFPILTPQTIWDGSTDPDFPNAQRRLYWVELNFSRPGASTIIVQGQTEFFVTSRDSLQGDGTTAQYWQLVGQVDRTDTGSP